MTNILTMVENDIPTIKVEVSGKDLLTFSNQLIRRAKYELSSTIKESKAEQLLTKKEVKKLCQVCDSTLWHWARKNYLRPVKVGVKVKYRLADVERILGIKL